MAASTGGSTTGAWAAVILMLLGFTVAVVAFVVHSWPLGIAGGVLGLIGIVLGKVFHLMETTH